MKSWLKYLASAVVVSALSIPGAIYGMQAAPAKAPAARSAAKDAVTTAPSSQEIADAKAKGLVWANTSTKIYHKDGAFYGATKRGKFMTEDEATKAGYRAAKQPGSTKKAAPKK